MTLAVTVYVREGVVMAADSRLTIAAGDPPTITQSDGSYKLFLAEPNRIGISTAGQASVDNEPIAGHIESFINNVVVPRELSPEETAQEIIAYFQNFQNPPDAVFDVCGYPPGEGARKQVWYVSIGHGLKKLVNESDISAATYIGESDVLDRLLQYVVTTDEKGQEMKRLPFYPIPFQSFPLQEAIDFAVYAVGATISSIRFQTRPKTVGGPIDVLVIRPTEAHWIRRKQLTFPTI